MSSTAAGSPTGELHVLFCIAVLPEFYAQPAADFEHLMRPFFAAFDGLGERFGLHVLGTLDDVYLTMGPTLGWPWTCYILAAAPDIASIRDVTRQLMDIDVGGDRLWRYAKVEARIGPPLDFGTT